MQKPFSLSLTVEDNEGVRLDRWLKKLYPNLPQGIIEKLLRLGKIRIDGKKAMAKSRLMIGQVITIPANLDTPPLATTQRPQETTPPELTKEDEAFLEALILWEDGELLVLNKPSGLATQGGTKTTHHLDGLLSAYGLKNGIRYRLVHRLDRDTSGVFLVAKTLEMATYLTNAFRQGMIKKTYWAIVVGQPKPGQGTLNFPLLKGADGHQEKVGVDHKNGKPAITHYRTVKGLQKGGITQFAWLELTPETGRTHQLRVHTAFIGHPILGDGKYGGKVATAASRNLHLHARAICFPDRSTGTPLTFMAPPSSVIESTLKTFKVDWEYLA